jgi:tRNA threonylcarbamoyladenosine biosynthesis protein TsaE
VGESASDSLVADEAALAALAREAARQWRAICAERPLSFGLLGTLGAGKTVWVRAMLQGLGYAGRVPSPTYTLMEIYDISGISLIHMDFYRLADAGELEALGLRDWQGQRGCWVVAEWADRVPEWLETCDLVLELDIAGESARRLRWQARTDLGRACIDALAGHSAESV